jgi:hypothetical protein
MVNPAFSWIAFLDLEQISSDFEIEHSETASHIYLFEYMSYFSFKHHENEIFFDKVWMNSAFCEFIKNEL